jgi:drug/metabolite transporter (DMT)-like permease
MNGSALTLVLTAALVHAIWNLCAKRVPDGGAHFVFLYYTVGAVVVPPVAVVSVVVSGQRPTWTWLAAGAVTALLHTAYGVVLQRGYDVGDLTVVYPLARGGGALMAVVVAVGVLGERPGWLGAAGALLIVAGVFAVGFASDATTDHARRRAGVRYGLLTGAAIAAYTLWDAHSLNALSVPPLAYFACGIVLESAVMAPYALCGDRARTVWRSSWRPIVATGVLSPVAYLLVLYAMRIAPVSLVAPTREVSIVLGGIAGWLLLHEPHPARRIGGSVVVLAGIIVIALA